MDLVTAASDAVAQHHALAVLIAFLAAIVEAVAVLGILVPGTPILMAVAAAAAAAGLPILPILIVSVVGAVIGDGISFWLGHAYGGHLRGAWPLRQRPWIMAKADAFFGRYGTASVAVCRFIPVLRSTVPLVAGMSGLAISRFFFANVASALVWAPVHVLPAQLAGQTLTRIEGGDWRGAVLLGGALVAGLAVVWIAHRLLRRYVTSG